MAKLLVFLCVALLAMTMVMSCNLPGLPCTSQEDCCAPFICNPWAQRCTKAPRGIWGGVFPPLAPPVMPPVAGQA